MNITENMPDEVFKKFRAGVISLIMATDLSKQSSILEKLKQVAPSFDLALKEHRDIVSYTYYYFVLSSDSF